jgi:hypothetical protein
MKYKNGQIETVGDSYAKGDPQVWNDIKKKKEENLGVCLSSCIQTNVVFFTVIYIIFVHITENLCNVYFKIFML